MAQSSERVPDYVRYEAFFRRIALVANRAEELNRSTHNGNGLKAAVCAKLTLAKADCNVVLDDSITTESQLRALDVRARAIIDAVHGKYPHGGILKGTVLPPPPPELAELQAQRRALVLTAADALVPKLSTDGLFAVQKNIFAQVTTTDRLPHAH